MLKTAGKFILIVLAVLAVTAGIGYYTINRDFNVSRVISMFSLYGYGVVMFFLWYASIAPFAQKKKAGALVYISIALALFFSYSATALGYSIILSVALAGIAGILAGLQFKNPALLVGLASAVHFEYMIARSFWNKKVSAFVLYTAVFAALAVYFRFFPIPKKR